MNYYNKVNEFINKYKQNIYSEKELQMSLEDISLFITEVEYWNLKKKLDDITYKMELTNFLSNDVNRKQDFMRIIRELEGYISNSNPDTPSTGI